MPFSTLLSGRKTCCPQIPRYVGSVFLFLSASLPVTAAERLDPTSLADMSLEELSNIEVSSVSRKPERLSDAAASIYVISAEDIRRSGARSLPEALRLAPNLQVARDDAQTYAITARGFNSTTANKLQVLIDGRIVYTPLYSGVFWDATSVMLEDIERIEVISGPAAASWGSNAVNGVINVITRSAGDTQGGLVAVGGGNTGQDGGLRYGATLPSGGHYRVYANVLRDNETRTEAGNDAGDAWHKEQVGFRVDTEAAGQWTLQGDAYHGVLDRGTSDDGTISGINLMSHWQHPTSTEGNLQLLTYFDHRERELPGTFAETLDILHLELHHNLHPTGRHRLAWGLSYRSAWDSVDNSSVLAFLPADKHLTWSSLFLQDQIRLRQDLKLTLAARWEENSYTGLEFMPSVRLAWQVSDTDLIWAALSRAVRTPSRLDRELFIPILQLEGGPDFESEIVHAAELGYRGQSGNRLSYSLTLFHHDYDDLRTLEPIGGGSEVIGNGMEGTSVGLEGWGVVQLSPRWRVNGGFMVMDQDLQLEADSEDDNSGAGTGRDPNYQLRLGSSVDLGRNYELDLNLRRVGALSNSDTPAYTTLDARLGWRPNDNTELSLSGFNLLDTNHAEFGSNSSKSEFERSLFLKLLYRY